MDSEKIVENMKAVLKATKISKTRKKKRHKKTKSSSSEAGDDETIADLMSKSWKMKSPLNKTLPQKQKVNAFEKLMNSSKRNELSSPESPTVVAAASQKRKYTKKKTKHQRETESEKIEAESDLSILDEESLIKLSKRRSGTEVVKNNGSPSNGIQKFFSVKEIPIPNTSKRDNTPTDTNNKLTRKRNRGNEIAIAEKIPQDEEKTPKKRRKAKDIKILSDSNENVEDDDKGVVLSQGGGSRPRRSCANRIDYSLLESPEKKSPEKKRGRRRKDEEADDPDCSISTIEIDENSPIKENKSVKLAPLFIKKLPKPAIDPALKEARRNFLFSTELPSNIRATIDKQKQLDVEILSNDLVAFPLISHITQLPATATANRSNGIVISKSRIKINETVSDDESFDVSSVKCGQFTSCTKADYLRSEEEEQEVCDIEIDAMPCAELSAEDVKNAVRKIKDTNGNLPVNRLFKQLLRKQKNAACKNAEISFRNSLFIDIFKPLKFDEYFIATQSIEELKRFLTTWNDRNNKVDDYDSDSNSRGSWKGSCGNNCVVLSGSNGVGKSSSVYALANDLNYEVIEINAGSRRSGKKLLQDLYEATQSHRVESNSEYLQNNDAILDKRTIILIEDAEIVFDSDDGFISSIQQLINITKRPVILTTNNRTCHHLQKFIHHNEIIYESPPHSLATSFLSLLCLAAASSHRHRQIDEAQIEQLYALNECDLRKTINQIEFFIRSDYDNGACGAMREKRGKLMEFYEGGGDASETKAVSRKDLSERSTESSIMSTYSVVLDVFQNRIEAGEMDDSEDISYDSRNLMDEISHYFDSQSKHRDAVKIKRSLLDDLNIGNVSSRVKAVDYSPLIRQICRVEKAREVTSRRSSRSHYLRFMLLNNSFANNYFNAHCEVFQQEDVVE